MCAFDASPLLRCQMVRLYCLKLPFVGAGLLCLLLLLSSFSDANRQPLFLPAAFQTQHNYNSPIITGGLISKNHRYHRPFTATTRETRAPHQHCSPSPPLQKSTTQLSLVESLSSDVLVAAADLIPSPEPIHTAFSVANFGPQPFWLLMILFPKASFTKKIMGGLEIPLLFALVHFFIVVSSTQGGPQFTAPLDGFNDVFDPSKDQQTALEYMMTFPNFVAEEWSHVLTWDLFVGRWIWLDGLKRGIFTAPSVLFCNLIGPPGLLLHWLICTAQGKPILDPNEEE